VYFIALAPVYKITFLERMVKKFGNDGTEVKTAY
jgi:hypothetical protein